MKITQTTEQRLEAIEAILASGLELQDKYEQAKGMIAHLQARSDMVKDALERLRRHSINWNIEATKLGCGASTDLMSAIGQAEMALRQYKLGRASLTSTK